LSPRFCPLAPFSLSILQQTLYYYLTQIEIVDSLHAIGEQSVSAYPSIKPSDIERVELDLPPLPEQVEIGHTLRALDDKIANNTKINNHLAA
jgi:type I restriction enzyme S subunit